MHMGRSSTSLGNPTKEAPRTPVLGSHPLHAALRLNDVSEVEPQKLFSDGPSLESTRTLEYKLSSAHFYAFIEPAYSPYSPLYRLTAPCHTNPPSTDLAIGTATENPPTPRSFSQNDKFVSILYDVLSKHAAQDPLILSQAQAFASPGGSTLGSGGAFFPQQSTRRGSRGKAAGMGGGGGAGGGGGGGASAQGGAGGAGRGGHVHLSDLRNPPDFGRIAWPEDILGSIEVDSHGDIVGEFQPSGTYRIITNEGM
ncbi:putative Ribosomal protein/NADH dehydrogenase domain-containing protein [Seiridium cardinale]|uniref:Ribosomal protein/NADH dehydrogenase domain-containing protein n=1 Tax=Seiridium cardinale TaxID=138064 RepID=A0ABR2Y742_9PEZI